MKPLPSRIFFAAPISALVAVTAFAEPKRDDRASAAPHAGANASAALSTGGNPAAAMGAAQLHDDAVPSDAALISGNAGTVGVNGDTGTGVAAGSAHGLAPLRTANTESIGMRRERAKRASQTSTLDSSPMLPLPAHEQDARALDGAPMASDIRGTTPEARDFLSEQLDRNIETGERAMKAARLQARSLDREDRERFEAAEEEVQAAERRLRASRKAVERASAEEWEHARSVLAADYEAFTQAIRQAQRIAISGSNDSLDPERR